MTYTQFEQSGFDISNFTKEKTYWGANVIYLDENTRIKESWHCAETTKTHHLIKDALLLQRWTWFFWHTKVILYKELCYKDSLAQIVGSLLKTDQKDFLHSKL